jgi:pyrroline-5-carboxylate reductase
MKVGFYGFGTMAEALVSGFKLKATLYMTDPSELACHKANQWGVVTLSPSELIKEVDVLIVAVKPQQLHDIVPTIQTYTGILISLVAGIPLSFFQKHHRRIRCMPNLPSKFQEGMTALCFSQGIKPLEKNEIISLFETVGQTCEVEENALDGVTAISGSGPAFLYGLTDALMQHAEEFSLTPSQLRNLFAQTLIGAGKMMLNTADSVQNLAKAVMSPNGTTEAGFRLLQKGDLSKAYLDIVRAAFLRSKELGKLYKDEEKNKG